MKKYILIVLTFLTVCSLYAQTGQTNGELAKQYFTTGDYEKAVVYYDKFYDQDPFNAYPQYLKSLIALKEYDKAEKLIKKQSKKFPANLNIKVDLAGIYELSGEKENVIDARYTPLASPAGRG